LGNLVTSDFVVELIDAAELVDTIVVEEGPQRVGFRL
jgi:hypothetical protein